MQLLQCGNERDEIMQALSVMLNACSEAIRCKHHDTSGAWHAAYCAAVDPESVLEMAIIIKSLLQYIEAKEGSSLLVDRIKERIGHKAAASDSDV